MPAQKIGNVAATTTQKKTKQEKLTQITIKSGDTLTGIAKKFGMTPDEFKAWTGLKSSTVKSGQKISLPNDTIPEGKGIFALVRKYNMTLEEFGKLNNLPKPYKDYNASKGERFYVKKHGATNTAKAKPQANAPQPQAKPVATTAPKKRQPAKAAVQKPKTTAVPAKMTPTQINRAKWGSSYSPKELAQKIYDGSKSIGAVGKPDFDALINEINPKNVDAVLKAYKNNPQNKSQEGLVDTITSEISSKKDKRKAAVMKIYDNLAKAKGTPAAVRTNFVKELDSQFSSFGMVNASKMEETMDRMMAHPSELAAKMKKDIDTKSAAIGKSSFQELLSFVNSKNASQIITAYNKSGKNSLIKDITHEIGDDKNVRKNAVMKIYDALAQEKNIPPSNRNAFQQELNKQFDSWGMVDTQKLDTMISSMLKTSTASKVVKTQQATKPKTVVKTAPNEKYIENGFEVAVGGKRSVASTGAIPPIPVNSKGEVIAEVIKFKPSNPNGPLKGKTIMVNAGHGWSLEKKFKPGTHANDSNGKEIPEWYKNRNFADKLITELSAQGATVVYTTGDAKPVCNAKRKYKADMLISLHCNAMKDTTTRGLEVFYPKGSPIGEKFANITERHLDKLVSFGEQGGANDHCKTLDDSKTQHKSIGLLQINKEKTPSILIEMGYQSNAEDLKNIDSGNFRQQSMEQVTSAVKEYFHIKG